VFASTIASGALPNLQTLDLDDNQISDEGMAAFSDTIASGAHGAPKLHVLESRIVETYTTNMQISRDACCFNLHSAFRYSTQTRSMYSILGPYMKL
jgi:hypothetical protein